MIDVTYTTK